VFILCSYGCNVHQPDRYSPPPERDAELRERLSELREEYQQYLQSLPDPLDLRSQQVLNSDHWLSKYEVYEGDYENLAMPEPAPWHTMDLDDSGWEQTTVPEWRYRNIKLHTTVSCILWYRNSFKTEIPEPGERVYLNFTGVDWEAEVWLNGEYLGDHLTYYEPFRFDVTDILQEENILAVRIKTGQLYGMSRANWGVLPTPPAEKQRVYLDSASSYVGYQKNDLMSGAGYGIYRTVYLERTGEVSVDNILVRGYPGREEGVVKTDIVGTAGKNLTLNIQIIPENFKGKSYSRDVSADMKEDTARIITDIPMPDAKIWTPSTPWLYRCRVFIKDGDKVIDGQDALFGYRSFEMVSELNPMEGEPAGRFLLNGDPVYLRGTNVQGFNLLAHWGQREKLLDLIFKLKAANYNAIRSCQHVQYREVRELLDRLGIMSQQDQGGRHPYERGEIDMKDMPEEDWKIVEKRILSQMNRTSAILARECYNNPGVVLISNSNEAGEDRGPWEINPKNIVEAALAVDPERIIKPICGHHAGAVAWPAEGTSGYDISPELWKNVIDDVHTYQGWYIYQNRPDLWTLVYEEDERMVTVGEFGGEALDSYETMKNNYPNHWGPVPAKDADTIWGDVQTQAKDIKQVIGLRGKIPESLGEVIQASQTVQADILTEVTKGFRISNRVSGYFQFHYYDALAAYWPKSVISHDRTPKKGYYAMAQVNQELVPLPRITENAESLELWVVNDGNNKYDNAILSWSITNKGEVILQEKFTVDIPAGRSVKAGETDLSEIPLTARKVTIYLKLNDFKGQMLSLFQQEFYLLAYRPEFREDMR